MRHEPKPKLEIIFLQESVLQSWMRDLGTFALFAGLIGIGALLDSSAMQWAGLLVAFIVICMCASGKAKRMTIAQARAHLDSLESEDSQ